jgi:hypothetical protein
MNPPAPGRKPAILAGCGCASLLLSFVLFGAAIVMVAKDGGEVGSWLPASVSTVDMAHYTNTREGRVGNLQENYVDFSFDYPKTWTVRNDPEGTNFVTAERQVEEKTWENLNVGYFQTAGSEAGNEAIYSQLVAQLQGQFEQQFAGLRKVHEGKTTVGDYAAYEGLFEATVETDGKPVKIYTRAILLPTPDQKKGVTLLMMGTSFHPEIKEATDLGTKGELPAVLKSFKFGG